MRPFSSFLLFGTANACIKWEILILYEAIGNFGSTSIEIMDNGVTACQGNANNNGNGRYQANCIAGYEAILDTEAFPYLMDVADNNGFWIETVNCDVDVPPSGIDQLVSCFGDDGTC